MRRHANPIRRPRFLADMDPLFSHVVLLLTGDQGVGYAYFKDGSSFQKTQGTVAGGATIGVVQCHWGESIVLDGTDDSVRFSASPHWNFATNDLCIETFYHSALNSGTYKGPLGINYSGTGFWGVRTRQGSANNFGFSFNDGSWRNIVSTSNVNDSKWHHLAVCRYKGVFYLFVDGLLVQTETGLTSNNVGTSSYDLILGYNAPDNLYCQCYLDCLRITYGHPRYVGNFIPMTKMPRHIG